MSSPYYRSKFPTLSIQGEEEFSGKHVSVEVKLEDCLSKAHIDDVIEFYGEQDILDNIGDKGIINLIGEKLLKQIPEDILLSHVNSKDSVGHFYIELLEHFSVKELLIHLKHVPIPYNDLVEFLISKVGVIELTELYLNAIKKNQDYSKV